MKVQAFRRTRVFHLTVSSVMWVAGSWRVPVSSHSSLTVVDFSDDGQMLVRWRSGCWCGGGEAGALLHCWWEGEMVLPVQTSVWGFLRFLNSKSYHVGPSSPTPRCISKRSENTRSCRNSNAMFLTGIIHNSQKMETAQMSTSWWMDRHNVYSYMREYSLAIKRVNY